MKRAKLSLNYGPDHTEGLIVGIDNGTSGGIAAVGAKTGRLSGWATMPFKLQHGENLIIGAELAGAIRSLIGACPCVFVVEACPEHSDRAGSLRSMGMSFGIIMAVLSIYFGNRAVYTVRSGNPLESWQRAMLSGGKKLPKGKSKELALTLAKALWPAETWIPERCHTPNTGIIDAALIAEFHRLTFIQLTHKTI